jgi:hypothetical protein
MLHADTRDLVVRFAYLLLYIIPRDTLAHKHSRVNIPLSAVVALRCTSKLMLSFTAIELLFNL